jgi:mRNA-degrading endonuclease toxin of MazEF toxin-antitoxin module
MTTTISEEIVQRRVLVLPSAGNALKLPSQIMIDKIHMVRHEKCREVIGHLDAGAIADMDQVLGVVVGLLD